jgi:hypothetical protein
MAIYINDIKDLMAVNVVDANLALIPCEQGKIQGNRWIGGVRTIRSSM